MKTVKLKKQWYKLIMENNRLAELQAKRGELIKAIKAKQKELDCFDVSEYYGEDDYRQDMREELGIADVIGGYGSLYHIDILFEMRYTTFRTMYNDYADILNKSDFVEYRELEEELGELENELLDIEDKIEQLENE